MVKTVIQVTAALMSPAVRASMDYATVRWLHADFHHCASKVIECVAVGDKAMADTPMTGEYNKISGDLTSTMMK